MPWGQRSGSAGSQTPVLTGDVQVGAGLHLAAFVAGEALEDPGVLRTQLLDAQAPSREQSVPGVLELADGHGILEPLQLGKRGPCMGVGILGITN